MVGKVTKSDIFIIASGLPYDEYKKEILRIAGRNRKYPHLIAEVLTNPEIMGKTYNQKPLLEIFTKLTKISLGVFDKLAKGLCFYEKDEKLDSVRRENAKYILISLATNETNSEVILRCVCKKIFRNTGEEPFEIIKEIISKNPSIFCKAIYYIRDRIVDEKNDIERTILRKTILRTILGIYENVEKENRGRVGEIVRPLIFHVLEDPLFEDALFEIGKKSQYARVIMNRWEDRDKNNRKEVLYRIEQRIKDELKERNQTNFYYLYPTGFKGTKHKQRRRG
ncbi:MAG: hypothetical protein QXL47_04075 [Candidatus Anstonellales archaeon]